MKWKPNTKKAQLDLAIAELDIFNKEKLDADLKIDSIKGTKVQLQIGVYQKAS